MIGEWHYGALDRGPFAFGIMKAENQNGRAGAYRSYMGAALRANRLVGCHWFQYRDEPTTGRVLDGENYQIGFTDTADTPYVETIAASREMGYGMYEFRAGLKR